MFTRTHHYKFPVPKELLKYRLVGSHVTIGNMDFEVVEDDHNQNLSIVPQIDDEEDVKGKKTLPITQVELVEDGNKTNIVLTSRIRMIDSGGPIVIMLFCVFLIVASLILLYIGHDPVITITVCAFSLAIFAALMIRMQMGYFDYVRKIHIHLKLTSDQITSDVRRQLFKHKMK
jgi:hypothetical protein